MKHDAKHDAEQDVEQETEQAGTDMEQSGTRTERHVEQDLGTDETHLKTAVQWKQQGKTYREIEDGLGVPKSTLHRYLKRSLPNTRLEPSEPHADPDETDDPTDGGAETGIGSHPSLPIPAPPSFPQNGVLFDYGMLQAIEDTLTTKQAKANFRAAVALSEEKARLNRNNGHGSSEGHSNNGHVSYESGEEQEARAMAKYIDAKRRKLFLDEDKPKHESDPQKAVSQLLEAIKLGVDLVPRGGGSDRLGDYRSGRQDEQKTFENAVRSGETNLNDLRLEDMRQLERLENRKLEFEIDKYDRKEAKTDKYIELGKSLIEGPLGKLISGVGEGAKNRIEGGPRLPLVSVPCPKCHNKFKTNPELLIVSCPYCGSTLEKQPSQSQAEPAPQPSTETEPEAQPSPGETQQESALQKLVEKTREER